MSLIGILRGGDDVRLQDLEPAAAAPQAKDGNAASEGATPVEEGIGCSGCREIGYCRRDMGQGPMHSISMRCNQSPQA